MSYTIGNCYLGNRVTLVNVTLVKCYIGNCYLDYTVFIIAINLLSHLSE